MQLKTTLLLAIAVSLLTLPMSALDLATDRSALLTLRSSVAGRTLLWPVSEVSPCKWAGVQCESDRVTALRLPGASLFGVIPGGAFTNLTSLRTLSLRLNNLAGPIPDFSPCINLRNLYLHGNRFSGDIPPSLLTLHGLVRLNLASNNLTGAVPVGFNKMTRLRTLFLEQNHLTGLFPTPFNLPRLEQFNVSDNLLNGSIPVALRSFGTASFLGNSLCGKPLGPCSLDITVPRNEEPSGSDGNRNRNKKLSGSAVAGIAVGSVFGFIFLTILVICLCRRRRGHKRTRSVDFSALNKQQEMGLKNSVSEPAGDTVDSGFSTAVPLPAPVKSETNGGSVGAKKLVFFDNSVRAFDLEDLLRASAEVLGKGTFGTTYKAIMEKGQVAAVKRLKDVNVLESEFRDKIEAVGSIKNENLVPLRAYFYSNEEKLLVHDFMAMGSLSALLHGNKGAGRTPLSWENRSSIALGAARGIEFLHSQGTNISHGNIKSSNILLDKDNHVRVSDFGLAHLVGPSTVPIRVTGYRAPEVTDLRRVSQKADIYSFGVLLLELLTGKGPTQAVLNEEGVDLPRWVSSVVREEWTSEVFDLELLRYQNVEEEMIQLLQLAIECAAQHPDSRPPMSVVRRQIEELCMVSSSRHHGSMTGQIADVDSVALNGDPE